MQAAMSTSPVAECHAVVRCTAGAAAAGAPPDAPPETPLCACGAPSRLLTSRSAANNGRQFYRCAKPQEDPGQCKFFQWADEAPTAGGAAAGAGAFGGAGAYGGAGAGGGAGGGGQPRSGDACFVCGQPGTTLVAVYGLVLLESHRAALRNIV